MCTLLLIYQLTVESSYLQNLERPAVGAADSIQFCLKDGKAWRIKTFAIDHDVHVWSVGEMTAAGMEALADENTEKHYGDILRRKIRIEPKADGAGITDQLGQAGLSPSVESPDDGLFIFWVPATGLYRTQSSPE